MKGPSTPPPLPRAGPRRPGRPRAFDREAALAVASRVFWQHGYEGASVALLTAAMGITPPSLYAAFGDKKHLFLETVERYLGGVGTPERAIAAAPTARAAVALLLDDAVVTMTAPDAPRGCLVSSAAIAGSAESADVQQHLAGLRRAIRESLGRRIARGAAAGEALPPAAADPEALAAHVMGLVHGLSVLARDGASRELLARAVAVALADWPAA